jgi:transposase
VGVGDPLTWKAIASKMASHPTWTQREIAQSLAVLASLVNWVKQWLVKGEKGPQQHGNGEERRFPDENVQVMVELLKVKERGHTYMIQDVQQVFKEEFGQTWVKSTLNKHLRKEYSHQKAIFEDVVMARSTPPPRGHHCGILDNHCPQLSISACVLTHPPLKQQQEIYFLIVSLLSSLVMLFLATTAPFISGAGVARWQPASSQLWGGEYKLLPKYCPEFSPAKKVVSFLKAHLHSSFNVHNNLFLAIVTILNKITLPTMTTWYQSCGWLH